MPSVSSFVNWHCHFPFPRCSHGQRQYTSFQGIIWRCYSTATTFAITLYSIRHRVSLSKRESHQGRTAECLSREACGTEYVPSPPSRKWSGASHQGSSATSGTLRNGVRLRAADRSRLPLITHLRSGSSFGNRRVQFVQINACAIERINLVDAPAFLRRSSMFIALRQLITCAPQERHVKKY